MMIPTLKKPNTLFFILLLLPFIKPVGLDIYPWISKLFLIWKLLSLAYLIVALLPKCIQPKPKKKPAGFIGLGVFWVIYFAGCLRAGADVVSVGTAALSCFLLIALISYELRVGNGMVFLRSLSLLSVGCILAHVLSVFLVLAGILNLGYGDGSPIYLFGMDNYSAFFLYPMVFVTLYYDSLRHGKISFAGWGLLVLVTGIYLLTASLTAAGAGLIMILLAFIQRSWKKIPKIKGIWWVVCAMAVILVLICRFQIQNLLANLLTAASKGITLNSRTIIWDMVLDLITQKPIFGHGSFTPEQIADYILYGTTHAHNLLLELLLRAGIIGCAGYLLFLCGFIKFGTQKSSFSSQDNILLVGLIGQLVLSFMDFYPTIIMFYLFMGILYFRKYFFQEIRAQKQQKCEDSQ